MNQNAPSDQRPAAARLTRRSLLKTGAAASVVVAGGLVWRAVDRGAFQPGQGPAYEPWRAWRTDRPTGPLGIVHAGILAASPHNTQPWAFHVGDTAIEVYADTSRNLGTMDPYLREMHIGLGCALENMRVAAAALGYAIRLEPREGTLGSLTTREGLDLVARVKLTPGEQPASTLYGALDQRHTNRGPYTVNHPAPTGVLDEMQQAVSDEPHVRVYLLDGAPERRAISEGTVAATQRIVADAAMVQDSHRWFRHTWEDVQTHRDGPTLDAVGLPPLITAMAKMLPPLPAGKAHATWLKSTRDVHCATAAGFGLIAVRDLYDRVQTLAAGRIWQRLHLLATLRGVAMHPLNQMPEIIDRDSQLGRDSDMRTRLADLTADPAWQTTFAFRFGLPARAALPSPRRPVEAVLMS